MGKNGVEQIIEFELEEAELKALSISVETIADVIHRLIYI